MRGFLPGRSLDESFRVVVTIKAIDGVLEMAGGLALIFVPIGRLQGWVAELATREIAEDPHAVIANFILALDQRIHPHAQLFAVIYLLGHGALKLFLATALLKQKYVLYPVAMGFLLAFILYQTYRIGVDHSVLLLAFTIFDFIVLGLTYVEWNRHRGAHHGA
jgi:uncharacterized membrane protein